FACTRSGHIFEIDYSRVAVKNVRRLLPGPQQHADCREKPTFNTGPGVAINSISVSPSFCATGSEDGFLRLWTLDFSAVILEAGRWSRVLAATSTGNLGFLDVSSRGYNTLMRSHTDTVLGFSVDGIRRHLTTASADGTIRLYDFVSEDNPCSVAFHPHEQTFSCGFSSGTVRVFDISSAKLLAEHKQHRGEVIGLAFSSDGEFMFSADSEGSLALYTASEEDHSVTRGIEQSALGLRDIKKSCNGNVVARGTERAPDALAVSSDSSRLAFVGPSSYIVTIADARSLDELDSALKVCFSPASTELLLITTSAHKILWLSTKTGRLLRQVTACISRLCQIRSICASGSKNDINEPIRQVRFTPDQLGVISVGDAIFLWDFLADPVECLTDRLFAYSCGCVVVVEHLHTGTQRHLQGHSNEISCLAISNDAQTMASAAGGPNSRSLIYIWDVQAGTCRSTVSYHKGAVQSLAFSRDDLFFLSVGLALWRTENFQLLSTVNMSGPIHEAAFSPSAASQMACVGSHGVYFCLIHTHASNADIKVNGYTFLTVFKKAVFETKVVVEQEIMLDGTMVSAAFDTSMDMGIVGTTAGTLWYINWSDNSSIRLVSGHRSKVNDVVFSCDEHHFATCSEDGSVRVWSTSSYELVVQFQVINQACGCLCWSPSSSGDSSCIAAGYGDGTLRIFRLASTDMEMKLHPHYVAVTAVTYSASGHVILSAGTNGLCKKFGLEGNEMFLAAGADRRVSVWATDWSKEKCDLLDWLSFPAPPNSAVLLLV
ncbi:hypothetical protein GOODEAATRI_009044, partial [Goodea atripinnis]